MIEAYPLYWPEGWTRTPPSRRRNASFVRTLDKAVTTLMYELRQLKTTDVILSTNVPTRRDGLPASNLRPVNDDPGAAVYFKYKAKPMTVACDHYFYVHQNVRAIALTIEAIRAIERYGASDMMERVFRGFTAIPEKAGEYWRDVLEIPPEAKPTKEQIEKQFRFLALVKHPDKGGTLEEWQDLVNARENAFKDLGVTR